jgi:hypothetical protein
MVCPSLIPILQQLLLFNSSVWPPSGRPDDRIRIEAFHRSSAFRSTDFVSKYIQSTDKTDRDDGYARLRIEDLAFDYTF